MPSQTGGLAGQFPPARLRRNQRVGESDHRGQQRPNPSSQSPIHRPCPAVALSRGIVAKTTIARGRNTDGGSGLVPRPPAADHAQPATAESCSEGRKVEPQISQMARIKADGRSAPPNDRSERAWWNRKTGKIVKSGGTGSARSELSEVERPSRPPFCFPEPRRRSEARRRRKAFSREAGLSPRIEHTVQADAPMA